MNVRHQVLQLRDRVEDLEQRAQLRQEPTELPGHKSQPVQLNASTLMLATPGIGEILRENFVAVPAAQVESVGDRDVAVTCSCGRELTLAFGALKRCSCWRFYFNGATLKVTEPPAPDDVVMCDDCDCDLPHQMGAWIRVAGEDRFVCGDCHERASQAGDVDLFGGPA